VLGIVSVVIAYLLGSIPFGYIIVRLKTGSDIRASGSGNIGATNVLRTTGRAAGVLTLLLDFAKGFAAVWLASRLTGGDPVWTALAAVAVLLGHGYPVFLGFKGGKAVASTFGAFELAGADDTSPPATAARTASTRRKRATTVKILLGAGVLALNSVKVP